MSQPTSGHEHSTSEDSDDEGDDTDDDDVPHRADGELPDAVFVPSVPERPRILSSSSSSSDSMPEVDSFDLVSRNSLQIDLTKNEKIAGFFRRMICQDSGSVWCQMPLQPFLAGMTALQKISFHLDTMTSTKLLPGTFLSIFYFHVKMLHIF